MHVIFGLKVSGSTSIQGEFDGNSILLRLLILTSSMLILHVNMVTKTTTKIIHLEQKMPQSNLSTSILRDVA